MAALRREVVRHCVWVYLLGYLTHSSSAVDIKIETAIQVVNECYDQCRSLYKTVYNFTLASSGLEKFTAEQNCDAVRMANYTCSAIAGIYSCFRDCNSTATLYLVTYSPTEDDTVVEKLYWNYCSVDGMNCRAMDSYYCEVFYNRRLCDHNLDRYIECVNSMQEVRGCPVSSSELNCFPSQLVIRALVFDSMKYCVMAPITDLVGKNQKDIQYAVLQSCETVINFVCLGYVGYVGSGVSASFASNTSCDAFSRAMSCITSTMNSTLWIGSKEYVAPCRLLPDAERALQSLSVQLRSMMPARCSGQMSCHFQQGNSSDEQLRATLRLQSPHCMTGSTGNDSSTYGNSGGTTVGNGGSAQLASGPSHGAEPPNETTTRNVRLTLAATTVSSSDSTTQAGAPETISSVVFVYSSVAALLINFALPLLK